MKKHHLYYFSLGLLFFSGIVTIIIVNQKQIQETLIVFLTLCYVGFGIIHHYIHHDLNVKIMIEYTLVGAIGLSVLLFIIEGAL